ncbi:helix-turn-helix domain-containing protein [Rhizobium sp. TAL182]|uniref:helix-turn-helix domain-containing protein n=1 Tax=Rhizobium sp. TAL182 TaxID=2020313 RepID=UPI0013DE0DC1|nr:helix-turn-helix domain-containing protein [Rhizobium sp. TAL182]
MSSPRFSIIPAWIVTDSRLKGSDLKVLCLLGTYTNKEGWCRRSQVKMAEQLGCGRSTVQDSLNRLAEIGAVEKQKVASADGRDSAHWYRVLLDRAPISDAFGAWDGEDEQEFGPIKGENSAAPPAGIPAPPAGPRPAPPAGSGPAPINDSNLTPPDERRERERDRDEEGEENPKALERRFRAWFARMPGYLDDSEPNARREWNALTSAERAECERLTPIWLEERKKIGRTKAVAASTYLSEKRWERIPDEAKAAHQRAKAQEEQVLVKPFGPIWAGLRSLALLDGPAHVEVPDDIFQSTTRVYEVYRRTSASKAAAFLEERGITVEGSNLVFPPDFHEQEYRRRVLQEGYPEVTRLHRLAAERAREPIDKRFLALVQLCEAVPVGSPLYERWREYHSLMNWQFVPDPGQMPVVFFPRGGPDGLRDFEIAARAALGMERGDDDAA